MKKNLLLTIILLMAVLLPSSMQAQEKEKGFFMEGSIAYAYERKFWGPTESYLNITPTIGYQFNPKWNLGLKMELQCGRESDYKYIGFIPFARYNFCKLGKVSLFTEAKMNLYDKYQTMLEEDDSYVEAGFSLGAYLPLNRHLKIICQYLHVGYSEQYKKGGAFINSGDWGIDANIKRLNLGLNWTF